MKQSKVSIILSAIALLFLFSTFFLQYEYLFITRIVSVIFTIAYLIIEIKKEYFSINKKTIILFGAVSIGALIVSILLDHSSTGNLANERDFFIPVYASILVAIMYKEFDNKTTEKQVEKR